MDKSVALLSIAVVPQVLFASDSGPCTMYPGSIVEDHATQEPGGLDAQEDSTWTSSCLWERFNIGWRDDTLVQLLSFPASKTSC